jgi:hypothetical protein
MEAIPGPENRENMARLKKGEDMSRILLSLSLIAPATLPRGAEVVISSRDASAIDAIHAFLRFHKAEHRALGQK